MRRKHRSPSIFGAPVTLRVALLWLIVALTLTACQMTPATSDTQPAGSPALTGPGLVQAPLDPLTLLGQDTVPLSGEAVFWEVAAAELPTVHAGKPKSPEVAAAPPQTEFEGLGDGPLKRSNFFLIQRAYPADDLESGVYAAAVESMRHAAGGGRANAPHLAEYRACAHAQLDDGATARQRERTCARFGD
ncbi:MAG: hypothetical protein R2856_22730 [Caldilineaceae bacterium]